MFHHLAQDAPSDFAGKKAGACMVRPRAAAGGVVQAGVHYNVTGHWFIDAGLKPLLVSPNANIDALLLWRQVVRSSPAAGSCLILNERTSTSACYYISRSRVAIHTNLSQP